VKAEGVYVRFEDKEHVLERVKLRRKSFVPGREDFSKVENNQLKAK
jgi:hypothetical protein